MIGGPNDVLVELQIVRAAAARRANETSPRRRRRGCRRPAPFPARRVRRSRPPTAPPEAAPQPLRVAPRIEPPPIKPAPVAPAPARPAIRVCAADECGRQARPCVGQARAPAAAQARSCAAAQAGNLRSGPSLLWSGRNLLRPGPSLLWSGRNPPRPGPSPCGQAGTPRGQAGTSCGRELNRPSSSPTLRRSPGRRSRPCVPPPSRGPRCRRRSLSPRRSSGRARRRFRRSRLKRRRVPRSRRKPRPPRLRGRRARPRRQRRPRPSNRRLATRSLTPNCSRRRWRVSSGGTARRASQPPSRRFFRPALRLFVAIDFFAALVALLEPRPTASRLAARRAGEVKSDRRSR